jgi:hypothetical protein
VTVNSPPVSLLCVCVYRHSYCTVQLYIRTGDQWNGVSLLNIYFFQRPQLSDSNIHAVLLFFSGIVSHTHRLTTNVFQLSLFQSPAIRVGVTKSGCHWVSLSKLIPHGIDPQSIGKSVQWNKYAILSLIHSVWLTDLTYQIIVVWFYITFQSCLAWSTKLWHKSTICINLHHCQWHIFIYFEG